MFDFLKPKEEPIFHLSVELDPYFRSAPKKLKVKPDGTVMNGRQQMGAISKPLWDYISQFSTNVELEPIVYNVFDAKVYGEYDRSGIFPDPKDRPYIYRCGKALLWPRMIPSEEYYCDMIDKDDHFDIVVDGVKVGTLDEREGRDRVGKFRSMLKQGYQATAQIETSLKNCQLFVIMRKV